MKTTFALFILLVTFSAQAQEIECLSAGGYYGNISVNFQSDKTHIVAAQGYAHDLSLQLGLPSNDAFHEVEIDLKAKSCQKIGRHLIKCAQKNVTIIGRNFLIEKTLKADVKLMIKQVTSDKGHQIVMLSLNKASASIEFGAASGVGQLGSCTVR